MSKDVISMLVKSGRVFNERTRTWEFPNKESVKKDDKVPSVKPKAQLMAVMPIKVNIKPLSVNEAFKGRRFKTPKYKEFQDKVFAVLPAIELPHPPYSIFLKFGFSSKASDWDNPIKSVQDCLSKHYKFNDKLIRKGEVHTEIVAKGKEYFIFSIESLHPHPGSDQRIE